jgi:hypothetical protein
MTIIIVLLDLTRDRRGIEAVTVGVELDKGRLHALSVGLVGLLFDDI